MHPPPNRTTASQAVHLDIGYSKPEDIKDSSREGNKDGKENTEGEGNNDADGWREDGELRETEEEKANYEAPMPSVQLSNETAEVQKETEKLISEKAEKGKLKIEDVTGLEGSPNSAEAGVDKAKNGAVNQQVKSTAATPRRVETNEEAVTGLGRGLKDTTDVESAAKPSEASTDGAYLGISAIHQAESELVGSGQKRIEQVSGEGGVLVRNPHPPRKWRSESAPLRVVTRAEKRTRSGGEAPLLGNVEEEELESGDGGEGIPLRKRSRPAVEKVARKHWERLPCRLRLTVIAELGVGWIREQVVGLMEQGLFIEVVLVAVGGVNTSFGLWDCVKSVTNVSQVSEDADMVVAFECGKWLERVWLERGRFLADNVGGATALCPRMLVICESARVRSLVEKAGVVDVVDKESVGVARFVAELLEVAKQKTGGM